MLSLFKQSLCWVLIGALTATQAAAVTNHSNNKDDLTNEWQRY